MHKDTRTKPASDYKNIKKAVEQLDPFALSICLGVYPHPYLTLLIGILWAKSRHGRRSTRRDDYAATAVAAAMASVFAVYVYGLEFDDISVLVLIAGILYFGSTRAYLLVRTPPYSKTENDYNTHK